MPNVMMLGGGAFGKWLGHEDEALINRVSALIKQTSQSSPAPFTMWEYNKMSATQKNGPHLTMLPPGSQTSSLQNCMSYPDYDILI